MTKKIGLNNSVGYCLYEEARASIMASAVKKLDYETNMEECIFCPLAYFAGKITSIYSFYP
jgi:hypothetical protein